MNRSWKGCFAIALLLCALQGCKKDGGTTTSNNIDNNNNGQTGTITPPNTPATAATQGFFLDGAWQAKTFTLPASTQAASKPAAGSVSVSVDMSLVVTKVSPYLYGNNANPYMGQFTSDPDLINYVKDLSPNIIRAPGGSLSDVYFFNATPGNFPADAPTQLLDDNGVSNTAGYWSGKNPAAYTMMLDNYYSALQQTNSTGIITVNYGYARYGTGPHPDQAAAHLAAEWVRYDKGRTKYWEVGNENYGNWEAGYRINTSTNQDGQPEIINGTIYGKHFKVFSDSMRNAAAETGATIKIGAVLVESASTANNSFPTWNQDVLAQVGNTADFYIVHNYYTPYNANSTAATILATPSSMTSLVMSYIKSQVQTAGAAQVPVALTEWNIQAAGSKQNVSNIAGLHAILTLGELIKNQYGEASRWDLANGWQNGDDQGMFNNWYNNDNEQGAAHWEPRPSFYYMYYFQKMFGDQMVSSSVSGSSDVISYASSFTSGQAGIVIVNRSKTLQTVSVSISNFNMGSSYYFYVLNGGTDNGDFSGQVYINSKGPAGATGGPANYGSIVPLTASTSGGINVNVPPYGAIFMVVDKK